jgi:hypothetical protein
MSILCEISEKRKMPLKMAETNLSRTGFKLMAK